MSNIDQVWVHCIPVYSKFLRGFYVTETDVKYSKEDRKFKQIFSDHLCLNDKFALSKKQTRIERRRKYQDQSNQQSIRRGTVDYTRRENIIYHIQMTMDELWELSFKSIDKKEGIIQNQVTGGRYDYTGRMVIVPDPTLRQDEFGLGYLAVAELLKFQITKYMVDLYDISHKQAQEKLKRALYEFDPQVYNVMELIIKTREIILLTGRNPSINYGSAMAGKLVKVIPDMVNGNCMLISPLILTKPNADFDGDIMYSEIQVIASYGEKIFMNMNMLDNFIISNNTSLVDRDNLPKKDLAVGWWAFNNCY